MLHDVWPCGPLDGPQYRRGISGKLAESLRVGGARTLLFNLLPCQSQLFWAESLDREGLWPIHRWTIAPQPCCWMQATWCKRRTNSAGSQDKKALPNVNQGALARSGAVGWIAEEVVLVPSARCKSGRMLRRILLWAQRWWLVFVRAHRSHAVLAYQRKATYTERQKA